MIGPGPYFLSYSSRGGPGIDSRPSVTATFAGNETERQRIVPLRAARGTIVVGEDALGEESIDCGSVDGARGLGRSQAAEHQQRRGTSPSAAVG